jgi:hypothetical protein
MDVFLILYSRRKAFITPLSIMSTFPVLDSLAKVFTHNLHNVHTETLLCVADHDAGDPGVVPPPATFLVALLLVLLLAGRLGGLRCSIPDRSTAYFIVIHRHVRVKRN